MRDAERLRAVQRRLRETHRKLHDLQGESIASLRDTLDADRRTIGSTRDALAAATRMIDATREAVVAAQHSVDLTRKTLDIVSEAHDAMTVLYESDDELEEIATEGDGDTP
jgi:hypothetical protein